MDNDLETTPPVHVTAQIQMNRPLVRSNSVYFLAQLCKQNFQLLREDLHSDTQYKSLMHHVIGRFNVWGYNLGAFRSERSVASLDWRLRQAPQMENAVQATLKDIVRSAGDAHLILVGKARNRGHDEICQLVEELDDVNPENQVLLEFLSSVTNELAGLMNSIKGGIDRLLHLAMLIRRDSSRPPRMKSGASISIGDDPSRDNHVVHLKDKYAALSSKPWLIHRLADAFQERRSVILRCQELRQKALEEGQTGGKEGEPSVPATTYEEQNFDMKPPGSESEESIVSGATSFATLFSAGDDDHLDILDLTRLEFQGLRLAYDEIFECPLCRAFIVMSSKHEWRRHVYDDLKPYVCTFQGCSSPLFATRHEWFGHELEFHRTMWHCHRCPSEFGSEELIRAHFLQSHVGTIAPSHISLLLKSCKRPSRNFSDEQCPFCPEWNVAPGDTDEAMAICRHLGRHLQQLSLDAIPLSIDGLVVHEGLTDESNSLFTVIFHRGEEPIRIKACYSKSLRFSVLSERLASRIGNSIYPMTPTQRSHPFSTNVGVGFARDAANIEISVPTLGVERHRCHVAVLKSELFKGPEFVIGTNFMQKIKTMDSGEPGDF